MTQAAGQHDLPKGAGISLTHAQPAPGRGGAMNQRRSQA